MAMASIVSACSSSDDDSAAEPSKPAVEPGTFSSLKELPIINDAKVELSPSGYDRYFNSNKQYQDLAGKTDFALRLAQAIGSAEDNYIFSPLSIQMAFAMLANGASENTYDEITKVIGMEGLSRDQLREYNKLLLSHFASNSANTPFSNSPVENLKVANSCWLNEGFPVYESFLTSSKCFYDAETYSIDFGGDDASDAINNWARISTNGKISNVVDKNMIKKCSVLLLNSILLEASWGETFDEKNTSRMVFTNADGKELECEMMHSTRYANYYSAEKFDVASLLLGRSYYMRFFLPHEGVDIKTALSGLNGETLRKIQQSESGYLDLQIPKFSLSLDYDLKEMMLSLGIQEAFSEHANFAALSPQSICVNIVKHNAYIDVHEKGIESAAVTVVGGMVTEKDKEEQTPAPIEFHVNRPFFFVIQDAYTGAIVFAGQVKNMY